MTATEDRTVSPEAISARILREMAEGATVDQALDAVCGDGTFEALAGDLVVNFGRAARVVEVRDGGDLVLREVGKRSKWIADPAKCRPAA